VARAGVGALVGLNAEFGGVTQELPLCSQRTLLPTSPPRHHQVNEHSVDVRLTQGFRASFVEPLAQVGARAAAAYGTAGPGAAPLLASCPDCSCVVVEHTEGAATGPDGRPLPATSDCWVDEPSERTDSLVSAVGRAASAAAAGAFEDLRSSPSGSTTTGSGPPTVVSCDSATCAAAGAWGAPVAVAARVEEASDCEREAAAGGADALTSGSDVDQTPERSKHRQAAAAAVAVGEGAGAAPAGALIKQQPASSEQQLQLLLQQQVLHAHQRRSRHHPEIQLTSQQQQQLVQQQQERHRDGRRNPLDAAVLASPSGLTALCLERPLHPPRCEWELDPRKVLVGRRLAVGGFAEVFIGKYEVGQRGGVGVGVGVGCSWGRVGVACWKMGTRQELGAFRRSSCPKRQCVPPHSLPPPIPPTGHRRRGQAPPRARRRHCGALCRRGGDAGARAAPQPDPLHRVLHDAGALHRAGGSGAWAGGGWVSGACESIAFSRFEHFGCTWSRPTGELPNP